MRNAGKVSKPFVVFLAIVVFLVGVGGTVYFVTKNKVEHKAKHEGFTRRIEVPPGETRMLSLSITDVPCAIYGNWRSKKTGTKAADKEVDMLSAISSVKVYNTDGAVAQTWENEATGNFSMDITKPGEIRFDFSQKKINPSTLERIGNALLKKTSKPKSTSRRITLNVKMQ